MQQTRIGRTPQERFLSMSSSSWPLVWIDGYESCRLRPIVTALCSCDGIAVTSCRGCLIPWDDPKRCFSAMDEDPDCGTYGLRRGWTFSACPAHRSIE